MVNLKLDDKVVVILKDDAHIALLHNGEEVKASVLFDSFAKGFMSNSFLYLAGWSRKPITIPVKDLHYVSINNKRVYPVNAATMEDIETLEELKLELESQIQALEKRLIEGNERRVK